MPVDLPIPMAHARTGKTTPVEGKRAAGNRATEGYPKETAVSACRARTSPGTERSTHTASPAERSAYEDGTDAPENPDQT